MSDEKTLSSLTYLKTDSFVEHCLLEVPKDFVKA